MAKALSRYLRDVERRPVLIFVDELDRVRPDYSVKFLEAIKHIFSVQGICFVLAVDRDQLEASVRQLYGSIDFENYYRRFVTREARLPIVANLDLEPFVEHLSRKFFDEKRGAGVRFPFEPKDQRAIIQWLCVCSRIFQLNPRAISLLVRIFAQFMATQGGQRADLAWLQATITLISILINKQSLYHQIGSASTTPKAVVKYIITASGAENSSRDAEHIIFNLLAFWLRSKETHEAEIIETAIEHCQTILGDTLRRFPDDRSRHAEVWEDLHKYLGPLRSLSERSSFQEIYDRLEQWRPFLE